MLHSTQKRSSGEPYLSPSSSRKHHHPTMMSRRSSSSLPKITSSSGSSTMGMILPLPPLKLPSSRNKRKDELSKSSCHVEIIHENDENDNENNNSNIPTSTNTERFMAQRSSRSKSCTDANSLCTTSNTVGFNEVSSSSRVEDHDHNHNVIEIEDYDEALSQEIALAVALIVAEYEMMKKKHSKKSSSSHSQSQSQVHSGNDSDGGRSGVSGGGALESKERMILGENTVIPSPSTVSSATSQLQFDPPELVKAQPSTATATATPKVASMTRSMTPTPRSINTPTPAPVKIRTQSMLWKTPPSPSRGARTGGNNVEVHRYLTRVQHFMNSLGYHRDGEPEIKINVRLSMKMQMITAKEMIRAASPIKCLHAVVLATYLTNCIDTVERFPIYFRSHVGGKEYKHIVLGIYIQGHYGALGISRDQGLQDKTMTYTKLSDLIFEFAKCYEQSGHILNEIKFGQVITHDQNSVERLFSKIGCVPISGCPHAEIESNVERFARLLRTKMSIASLRTTQHQQPQPTTTTTLSRLSRSRTSLHGSGNSIASPQGSTHSQSSQRTRAMSIGAIARRSSEERLSRVQTVRSKPPKSMRK